MRASLMKHKCLHLNNPSNGLLTSWMTLSISAQLFVTNDLQTSFWVLAFFFYELCHPISAWMYIIQMTESDKCPAVFSALRCCSFSVTFLSSFMHTYASHKLQIKKNHFPTKIQRDRSAIILHDSTFHWTATRCHKQHGALLQIGRCQTNTRPPFLPVLHMLCIMMYAVWLRTNLIFGDKLKVISASLIPLEAYFAAGKGDDLTETNYPIIASGLFFSFPPQNYTHKRRANCSSIPRASVNCTGQEKKLWKDNLQPQQTGRQCCP